MDKLLHRNKDHHNEGYDSHTGPTGSIPVTHAQQPITTGQHAQQPITGQQAHHHTLPGTGHTNNMTGTGTGGHIGGGVDPVHSGTGTGYAANEPVTGQTQHMPMHHNGPAGYNAGTGAATGVGNGAGTGIAPTHHHNNPIVDTHTTHTTHHGTHTGNPLTSNDPTHTHNTTTNATHPHQPHSSTIQTTSNKSPESLHKIGKIEKTVGSVLHSSTLKAKGESKMAEAEAVGAQREELKYAEGLERDAILARERAGIHEKRGGVHGLEREGLGTGAGVGTTGVGAGPGVGGMQPTSGTHQLR